MTEHSSLRLLRLADALAPVPDQGMGRFLPGANGRRMARLRESLVRTGDLAAIAALRRFEARTVDRFADLKIIALLMARAEDHAGYERAIRLFDPALAFDRTKARAFVGRGGGLQNLPAFRRLGKGQAARFEKIYLAGGSALSGVQQATQVVLPACPVVRFPAFITLRAGSTLCAVESSFMVRGAAGSITVGCDIARRLATVDVTGTDVPVAPLYLKRGITAFLQQIGAEGFADARNALARARSRIDTFAPVFSHGDLNTTNFDEDGFVWDWDSAGLRPYGFDAAYCCRERAYHSAQDILTFCAQEVERYGTASEDRLAFVYFTICFLHAAPLQRGRKGMATDLYQILLVCLKDLDA